MKEFRKLKANEIEVRVGSIKAKGFSLLLYKNARCDMNILDETVTPMNWQRHHIRDNANCIVSIWNEDSKQWIEKEDTGTESYTEKEKGLASDSFKRACFNWGIGRELYTAPFIWINNTELITQDEQTKKFKLKYNVYLTVEDIDYNANGEINKLKITNKGKTEYMFGYSNEEETKAVKQMAIGKGQIQFIQTALKDSEYNEGQILRKYEVKTLSELTYADGEKILEGLEK